MFLYFIIVSILFVIYSEYSIKNILFRTNSLGNISVNISSMFNFMICPLYKSFMWKLELLDVNYLFWLVILIIFYNIH